MNFPTYFESKKTLNLYGLHENLKFFKSLYIEKKLPKVLMCSGKKGTGKSTLISHLMFSIFDEKNYNYKTHELIKSSPFYNQFINNIYPNIIFLSGTDFQNVKVDDIRNLKKKIFQTSISSQPRFVIFDDVELFNINSSNALLKILEEPSKNNYFILINNKSKLTIETIKSRCLDIEIILDEKKRLDIIDCLIKKFNIKKIVINPVDSQLSPGQFIKFNHISDENEISIDDNFLNNLTTLLNLYKKNKNKIFIEMTSFLTDSYFSSPKQKKLFSNEKIIEYKRFVFVNISNFILYNLNQTALINNINNMINNE